MEEVVARIVEVERQSAAGVEQAEQASRERIEAHQRLLAEKKEHAVQEIVAENQARVEKALSEARARIDDDNRQFGREQERLLQDPARLSEIKAAIVELLLAG